MKVRYHKTFAKDYGLLDNKIKKAFQIRLRIFIENPYHITLNNHLLHGCYNGYRSINITGNFRAIYKAIDEETAIFVTCGTHSKLYK